MTEIILSPSEAAGYANSLFTDLAQAIVDDNPAAAAAVITELAGVNKAAAVAALDAANDVAGWKWVGRYLAPGHRHADPEGYEPQ